MCLQSVSKEKPASTGFGWKVFVKDGSLLRSENRGNREYQHDVWYQANDVWYQANDGVNFTTICTSNGQVYPRGFHIALRRQDARNFLNSEYGNGTIRGRCVIRKVEFRQAHTLGEGGSYFPGPQVIAEEIRIIRPAKGGSAYRKHNLTMQRLRGNIQS